MRMNYPFFYSSLLLIYPCFIFSDNESLEDLPPPQTQMQSVEHKKGLFITVDYLYWKAQEDQLVYAIEFSDLPFAGMPVTTNILEQQFGWSSGCKVGLGYQHPEEMWGIYLNWTGFFEHTVDRTDSDTMLITSALAGATDDSPIAMGTNAKSAWHLKFNMIDLELSRMWFVGEKFSVQPHLGIKGGWIDQEQHITYTDFTAKNFQVDDAQVRRTNDFASIGPRVGANLRWGKEVGIFGNFSGALLYGKFDVKSDYQFISTPTLQNGTMFDNKYRLRPTIQMILGLDWTHYFQSNKAISLRAAYETQYWWSQWQIFANLLATEFLSITPFGDLSFNGLTFEGSFSF